MYPTLTFLYQSRKLIISNIQLPTSTACVSPRVFASLFTQCATGSHSQRGDGAHCTLRSHKLLRRLDLGYQLCRFCSYGYSQPSLVVVALRILGVSSPAMLCGRWVLALGPNAFLVLLIVKSSSFHRRKPYNYRHLSSGHASAGWSSIHHHFGIRHLCWHSGHGRHLGFCNRSVFVCGQVFAGSFDGRLSSCVLGLLCSYAFGYFDWGDRLEEGMESGG